MTSSPVRKSLSKSIRFEVFKRDCFRCRYCGSTPDMSVLHVDHVVPVKEGGGNDPANLVTACAACNGGKAARPLTKTFLPVPNSPEVMREQTEQIRAYMASSRELREAHEEIGNDLFELWERRVGPAFTETRSRLTGLVGRTPFEMIVRAINITGDSKLATPTATMAGRQSTDQLRYFYGVLRNIQKNAAPKDAEPSLQERTASMREALASIHIEAQGWIAGDLSLDLIDPSDMIYTWNYFRHKFSSVKNASAWLLDTLSDEDKFRDAWLIAGSDGDPIGDHDESVAIGHQSCDCHLCAKHRTEATIAKVEAALGRDYGSQP